MRYLIFTLWIVALPLLAQSDVIRLSEPVSQTATTETFGQQMDMAAPRVAMAELAEKSQKFVNQTVRTEARISKVCQKKGCFFIAQQNEHLIRVSFKDYGFFVPTDSSGKTVQMTAVLVEKQLSEEQAAHFNKDLRSEASDIKPGVVYELVATSVVIPKGSVR